MWRGRGREIWRGGVMIEMKMKMKSVRHCISEIMMICFGIIGDLFLFSFLAFSCYL